MIKQFRDSKTHTHTHASLHAAETARVGPVISPKRCILWLLVKLLHTYNRELNRNAQIVLFSIDCDQCEDTVSETKSRVEV